MSIGEEQCGVESAPSIDGCLPDQDFGVDGKDEGVDGELDPGEFVLAEIYGFHCLIVASCFQGFSDDLLRALHVKILGRKTGIDLHAIGPIHSIGRFRGKFRKRVGKVAQLKSRLQAKMDFNRRMRRERVGR